VLEPLSGYLWLAARLARPDLLSGERQRLASAFNFGPAHESNRSVQALVEEILRHWPGRWEDVSDPHAVHEASLLHLSTDKAHAHLGWSPVWDFPAAVAHTVAWYRQAAARPAPGAVHALTSNQLAAYSHAAKEKSLPWALA
jgi:CDP-glucose 4,6-dehydratase